MMMASVLTEPVTFGWVLVTLLVFDSVWGFLAGLAFTGAQAQHAERTWALVNVVTAALLSASLFFLSQCSSSSPCFRRQGFSS